VRTGDDAALHAGLVRWREEQPDRPGAVELELSRPRAGLSSDTVFVEASWAGGRESLVVRIPAAHPLFPDESLERQARVQNAAAAAGVPVAGHATFVGDDRWIGTPFLVTPRVPGRVLATHPSYAAEGWLRDAAPVERARLFADVVGHLARLHTLDLPAVDAQAVDDWSRSGGGPDLAGGVAWWREYAAWATEREPVPDEYQRALDWCAANLPDAPSPSLLWGDAQLANAVFDRDFGVAAILDWEMATSGPAEVDVAWFLCLHELTLSQAGEPAGFPDRAQIVAAYEPLLGRPLHDLRWYDVFALLRSGLIVTRIGAVSARSGANASWTRQVPQLPRLRALLT
jgi:aminoglycoside phosphotransferase (APT) family kinase protein